MSIVEEGESYDYLPGWEQELAQMAEQVLDSDAYSSAKAFHTCVHSASVVNQRRRQHWFVRINQSAQRRPDLPTS